MGFDSISVTQTAKELNDATVDFRLEILAGNVEIEGMEVGKEGNKIVVHSFLNPDPASKGAAGAAGDPMNIIRTRACPSRCATAPCAT